MRVRCEFPEFPLSLLSDAVRPQLGNCLVNSPLATLTQVTVQVRAGFAPVSLEWGMAREALNLFMPLARGPNRHATGVRRFTQCQRGVVKKGDRERERYLKPLRYLLAVAPIADLFGGLRLGSYCGLL